MKPKSFIVVASIVVVVFILVKTLQRDEKVYDEAKEKGMKASDFPQAGEDYFKDMDGGVALTEDEIKGRNTWMVYSAGNDAFWDYIVTRSFGTVDLLKILTSYPDAKFGRDNRFAYFGLMNEPGFKRASKPGKYGLWLDERTAAPDPFEDEKKYPGINGGSFYGKASGIVGLRLLPNPDFDKEAAKKWDADKYFSDQSYYYNQDLKRPFRVAMSCAFCHASHNPVKPPSDPENPKWENLSANVGSQYFWIGRVFGYDLKEDNFIWQLFNSSPPGALETSMVSSDNINNPRTMNPIYNVGARLQASENYPAEILSGGNLDLKNVQKEMHVPHILKDGADAVGIQGALTRVYFNIGAFHQEWVRHFNPILGGKPQTPIEVKVARANSVLFQVTEDRVENLAKYFLKAATPQRLKDAPEGMKYVTHDEQILNRGKIVFAENCAACHSSKQPPASIAMGTEAYKDWMKKAVMDSDFLTGNYLSDEKRHPVSKIKTNVAASLGTNAMAGHIWDNFSSQTYKDLPAVGQIDYYDPFEKKMKPYEMPAGGRGYYRTPSLVSAWATAPFFHNNGLGKFTGDPSVTGRLDAFNDAIEKLLWPEKRPGSILVATGEYPAETGKSMPFDAPVYRTTKESWIIVHKSFLPPLLADLLGAGKDEFKIGPIPKGTPVNLLANIDLEIKLGLSQVSKHKNLVALLAHVQKSLKRIKDENLSEDKAIAVLKELVPDLYAVSKCPDFIVDKGHEFGINGSLDRSEDQCKKTFVFEQQQWCRNA